MSENNKNYNDNNQGGKPKKGIIPGICYNLLGKDPDETVYNFTWDQIKTHIKNSAAPHIPDVTLNDIYGVIVVNGTVFDPETKENRPAREISFQVGIDSDNAAVAGEYNSMLGQNIPRFSDGYRTFVTKFCGNEYSDKLSKPITGTNDYNGKKIKVIFLSSERVFKDLMDTNGYAYSQLYGGDRENYNIDVEVVYKPEYLKNGEPMLSKSQRIANCVDYFRVRKTLVGSGKNNNFSGVYNSKRIKLT